MSLRVSDPDARPGEAPPQLGAGAGDGGTAQAPRPGPSPEQRIRELERSLELVLLELSRIHNSRWWRCASWYWRVRAWALVWARRVTHPFEAARVVAPQILPIRLRARLLAGMRRWKGASAAETALNGNEEDAASDQLSRLGAPLARPAVLVLPIIDWGFRWQRPQQLATRLARRGWTVFYADLKRWERSSKVVRVDEPLAEGVWSVRLPNALDVDPYRESLDPRAVDAMAAALRRFAALERCHEVVVLCQLPFWQPLAERLTADAGWPVVYDRLDYHAAFASNAGVMVKHERALMTGADLVVASSRWLEEDARKYSNHVLRVANGCDWEHWSQPWEPGLPPELEHPIVGYYGAIAEWFDVELVQRLAAERPHWSFVLIGSTYGANVAKLTTMPNVHLLGERPYTMLPRLVAGFDAAIIPFRDTPLTSATDPVKLYEMMAMGLEVVAPPLTELVGHGDMIRLARGHTEFLRELDDAVRRGHDGNAVELRRAFARANRWEERVDRIERAFREIYPLVSIGIVTCNNLPLTRMCLESVYAHTAYPNFEVIVVDNGSDDATPEMLAEEKGRWEGMSVVLNATNRGFAAACNQALDRARGEIFCFLNNDTVVTPGWLSAMVRALRRNRSWGLVGPVTNAIGNEAKVAVGYRDLEELPEWAAGWVAGHAGESFGIPMLALFCAAMRRDVWERVGRLDERFEIGMFEDDDYCRRLRAAGYELRCLRDSFVHHWQRATFRLLGEESTMQIYERNRAEYEAKWRRGGA